MKKLSFSLLITAVLVSGAIVASAQTATSTPVTNPPAAGATFKDITFPIPELGNCTDKDSCRTYCNDPANMQACVAFAQAHGLMNKDDASHADAFRKTLQSGGGPGGCKTPDDCRAFCDDNANLDACTKFATDHGVKDANVEQSQKILAYLKAGGKMPGGCTSAATCKAYCSDFSHAQECFEFAKAAHIGQGQLGKNAGPGGANGTSTEATNQKFLSLVQGGQAPGGCTSKDACETYCKDPSHHDECTTFAVNAGFITQAQADQMKQDQGKGPGGCDSQEACQSYCNDQTHRDECLKFAKDRGILDDDEVVLTTQQLTSLRAGLEQAPPAVTDCLKSALGANIVDDIQSGAFVPNADAAATIKGCFQKFGGQNDPSKIFKNAPPQVTACLKEKLGGDFDKIKIGSASATPEMADSFRVCFESVRLTNGFGHSQGSANGENKASGPTPQMFQNFLRTAPPDLQACLKNALGDQFEALQSGSGTLPIDTSKLKSCFQEFRPDRSGPPLPEGQPIDESGSSTMPKSPAEHIPAVYADCINSILGDGGLLKLRQGELTADQKTQIAECVQSKQGTNSSTQPDVELPGQPSLPPAVVDCANSILGTDGIMKLQSGQVTADQKSRVYACVTSKMGTPPPAGAMPSSTSATQPTGAAPPSPTNLTQPPPLPPGDMGPPPGTPPPSPNNIPQTQSSDKSSFLGNIVSNFQDFWHSLFQ